MSNRSCTALVLAASVVCWAGASSAPSSQESALTPGGFGRSTIDRVANRNTGVPPENNICFNAEMIREAQYDGTLMGATNDGGAMCGSSSDQADVWFRYKAPCYGTLLVTTCGTNDLGGVDAGTDTVLSLHGACPGTDENELPAACNDDWPSSPVPDACGLLDEGLPRDSSVLFSIGAGETVLIRVSRHPSSFDGTFILNVQLDPVPPPNDECSDAEVVDEGSHPGTLACAANDGSASCGSSQGQPDVWYAYTAPSIGTVTVTTCGTHDMEGTDAGIDAVVSLHSGCPGTLDNELPEGCNDDWTTSADPTACDDLDSGFMRDSAVVVHVDTGQTILVRVSRYPTSTDSYFVLRVAHDPPLETYQACCFGDGECLDLPSDDCVWGGTSRGVGTRCASVICPGDGDCDSNGRLDLTDYALFADQMTGPGPKTCTRGAGSCADLDGDSYIDLSDVAIFSLEMLKPPSWEFISLGDLQGGPTDSHALGVSPDGGVAVGRSASAQRDDAFGRVVEPPAWYWQIERLFEASPCSSGKPHALAVAASKYPSPGFTIVGQDSG